MPSHALRHPDIEKRLATAPQWPSYTGYSQLVGITADSRCAVFVDPSLGTPALTNAHDLLADVPRIMRFNDATFGVAGGHVDVIVCALGGMTDGTGGADHMGCDFTTGAQIEICASFGNALRCSALFEAELSECSMNNQLCGLSTGEALSRWCAMAVSNNALSDFASAPTWFNNVKINGGLTDWVDQTDPTDRDYDSIGCGMAFLSWLMAKGLSFATLARAMVSLGDSGTLADLYYYLTIGSRADAWPKFQAAITALPAGVTSDDPFGTLSPSPPPPPSPPPTPTPGPGVSSFEWVRLAMDAMFAGLAKAKTAAEIKADVDSIPT